MFADASAIVAIIAKESDSLSLTDRMNGANHVLVSALAYYEAVAGLARAIKNSLDASRDLVDGLLNEAGAEFVPIDAVVAAAALDAFARYGKGRHRAALNMGDCFAYACAKVHRVPLLCKGGDFKLTDIKLA